MPGSVTPYDRRRMGRYSGAVSTYKRLTEAASRLTKEMKARGVYPKTSLERKGATMSSVSLGGSRVGRKIPAIRSRKGGGGGGDYQQFTVDGLKTGRKKRTTLSALTKEVRQQNETVIYRFQGMKSFDDWGNYWMAKFNSGDINTYLPLYCYDLTSVINSMSTGTVASKPFMRAYVQNNNGRVFWNNVFGQDQTGAGSLFLQTEKAPSSAGTLNNPHGKSRLLWNQVNLTLWGAKQKAVKYIVQVVKLDERLDPWKIDNHVDNDPDDNYTQAFYQSLIKPMTYNPIAYINPQSRRGMKVLKSYTTIIQPTSTTENDADPHSRILKWFMRWDRDLNYFTDAQRLQAATPLLEDSDFAQSIQTNDVYTTSKSKIFLLIRATNYKTSISEESTTSGSFDLMVRSCHVPL